MMDTSYGPTDPAMPRPNSRRLSESELEGFRAEARLMAQHPENDAIDHWIETNCDLEGWVWDGDFDAPRSAPP